MNYGLVRWQLGDMMAALHALGKASVLPLAPHQQEKHGKQMRQVHLHV